LGIAKTETDETNNGRRRGKIAEIRMAGNNKKIAFES
jgi:hypothetical protein